MVKKKYKCTECKLEIIILLEDKAKKLTKAECQDCKTMTMKPID